MTTLLKGQTDKGLVYDPKGFNQTLNITGPICASCRRMLIMQDGKCMCCRAEA